jgi:hypothetical protein
MPTDQILAVALLTKILSGEPLTLQDVERWGVIITTPINIASPKQEEVEQMKFKIRQALKATYFADQK